VVEAGDRDRAPRLQEARQTDLEADEEEEQDQTDLGDQLDARLV
jgi:hypothetical protein